MVSRDLPTSEAESTPTPSDFSSTSFVRTCRHLIEGHTRPNPGIYWADFLTTLLIAYTAASTFLILPFGNVTSVVCYVVAGLGLYRLSMFMHEVAHFRQGEMTSFRVAWNVLAGIPMMLPSFFYDSHLWHHNAQHYGTSRDGEYLPLARGTWVELGSFLSQIFVQPVVIFLRLLLGTPISFLHPRLRTWTLEHASSFVINPRFRRSLTQAQLGIWWTLLEIACSVRAWMIVIMVATEVFPWTRIPKLFALSFLALGLNHLRTLAAHRYHSAGEVMSHEAQFLDSTNITGGWLTELICPVGLRYHALHHLFPAIPYHRLGAAHRRLVAALPQDSPYHRTVYASYWEVIGELLGTLAKKSRGRGG